MFELSFQIDDLIAIGITLGIAVAISVGLLLISKLIFWRLNTIVSKAENWVAPAIIISLHHTRFFFFFTIGLYSTLRWIAGLPKPMEQFVNKLLILFLLLQLGFWIFEFISAWVKLYREKNLEANAEDVTTISALGFLLKLTAGLLLFLLVLANFGVDVTALIAGLGVGGIAIALATQNILGDLFASISIALDKPFVIGDFVIIDTFMGTVEYIGLETTRLRSLSGEQIIISNADLIKSRIRNYKRMQERRVLFKFGITYQTPYDKVARVSGLVKDIVSLEPEVRFDRVHFQSYGDFALIYEVVYYVLSPQYIVFMDINERINLNIMKTFQDEQIEFAYPTQTVYVKQQ